MRCAIQSFFFFQVKYFLTRGSTICKTYRRVSRFFQFLAPFDNNLPDRLNYSRGGFLHFVILRARCLDLYLLHLSRSVLHWKLRNNLSQNNMGQRATFPFIYVLLLSLMHLIHISLFISKLTITVKNPLIMQPSTKKKKELNIQVIQQYLYYIFSFKAST